MGADPSRRQAPGKKARTGRAAGRGKKRLRAGDAGFTVGGAQTAKRRKAGRCVASSMWRVKKG